MEAANGGGCATIRAAVGQAAVRRCQLGRPQVGVSWGLPSAPSALCFSWQPGRRTQTGARHTAAPILSAISTEYLEAEAAAAAAPGAGAEKGQQEEEGEVEAPFSWAAHWYAVGVAEDLDPDRPHPMMLLGRRMVLWRARDEHAQAEQGSSAGSSGSRGRGRQGSSSGGTKWVCFLDECPHRLVPLSEGRIDEQGQLQCSYHGWTFSGTGACTGIPQACPSGPEARAMQSPRACALSFPVRVQQGVLFVWPESGAEAAERAGATPLPMPAGLDFSSFRLSTYSREVQYGYDMLAENVMDPSHLPFAHHGVGPLRRSQGKPFPHLSVVSQLEGKGGFVGRLWDDRALSFGPVHFQAPNLFVYHRSLANLRRPQGEPTDMTELTMEQVQTGAYGPLFNTALYITPTAPGRSRLTILQGSNTGAVSPFFALISALRWPGHLLMHQVLDGDAYFLHAQGKALLTKQQSIPSQASAFAPTLSAAHSPDHLSSTPPSSALSSPASPSLASSAYFLPTTADRFVVAFRKWFQFYAGGRVDWPAEYGAAPEADLGPQLAPKEAVLDRHSTHTRHCTVCLRALSALRILQPLMLLLSFVFFSLSALLRLSAPKAGLLLLLGAASAAASFGLRSLAQQFVYTGYDHASRK